MRHFTSETFLRRPLSILAACGVFVPAVAQAETEPIRIEYHAVAGCPSVEQFRSQVFARTASARPAAEAETARTFVVTIETARDGVVGSLVVREPSGATLARKVEGTRCEQVATALSLATALAIDPQAPERTRDASANGSTESGEAPASASKASGNSAMPDAAKKANAPGERTQRGDAAEPDSQEPATDGADGRAGWNAALGPSFESGISPRLSLGGSARLERHRPTPGAWVSAFGVELTWLEAPDYQVSTASSSFRFLLAEPFVCPGELPLLPALRVGPCLGLVLGAVTGTGADLPNAATETRFWSAGDLRLRLRAEPSEAWFVELAFALVLPLTRYTFVFSEPQTQIYEVPWLGAAAGLRLGFRL